MFSKIWLTLQAPVDPHVEIRSNAIAFFIAHSQTRNAIVSVKLATRLHLAAFSGIAVFIACG
jgi:hypothetical protein